MHVSVEIVAFMIKLSVHFSVREELLKLNAKLQHGHMISI